MAIDGTGFIEKAVYARDTISDRYICITKCSPPHTIRYRERFPGTACPQEEYGFSEMSLAGRLFFVCLPTPFTASIYVHIGPPLAGKLKIDVPFRRFHKTWQFFLVPLYFSGFGTNRRVSVSVPLGDFRKLRITMRDAIRFSGVCNKHPCPGVRAIRWLS